MKKLMIRSFTLLFFLQVIIPPVSAEQLGLRAPDVQPPAIVFNKDTTELEDGIQTFSATVTDNIGVASVTLYYKGANDVAFIPKVMQQSASNPDLYTAQISIDSVISNKLEVYIRADDVSGNSIFEGQKFSPFTFNIVPKATTTTVDNSVTQPAEKEEGMSTLTMILIGIGVLALAGGGGSGGGGGSDTGTVTITTQLPSE
jgi:hypothetical protein